MATKKLFSRVLLRLLRPRISPTQELSLGYRSGHQTAEVILCVLRVPGKAQEGSEEVHSVKTYLATAYARVTMPLLRTTLERRGAPKQLVKCTIDGFVWIGKGCPKGIRPRRTHSLLCWRKS